MSTRLKLFFKWGIQFEEAYSIEEKSERKVRYEDSKEVEAAVLERFHPRAVEHIPRGIAEEAADESVILNGRRHSPRTKRAITLMITNTQLNYYCLLP